MLGLGKLSTPKKLTYYSKFISINEHNTSRKNMLSPKPFWHGEAFNTHVHYSNSFQPKVQILDTNINQRLKTYQG